MLALVPVYDAADEKGKWLNKPFSIRVLFKGAWTGNVGKEILFKL